MDASKTKTLDWVISEWTDKLTSVLEAMADARPTITRRPSREDDPGPTELESIWGQIYSGLPEPCLWVVTPATVSIDIGRRTLVAAGIDDPDDADTQNTYLEILSQSLSALGASFRSHVGRDFPALVGEPVEILPENVEWIAVDIQFGADELDPLWFACSQELLEKLTGGAKAAKAEEAPRPVVPEIVAVDPVDLLEASAGNSKTFNLLLEVSLPVSICFGRTFLPIKDVLKLTTGSIVELDRRVSEPVDIIVNNCVIARGEVVVVEGNYGVRIQQIASKYDRYRTGSASTQIQHTA